MTEQLVDFVEAWNWRGVGVWIAERRSADVNALRSQLNTIDTKFGNWYLSWRHAEHGNMQSGLSGLPVRRELTSSYTLRWSASSARGQASTPVSGGLTFAGRWINVAHLFPFGSCPSTGSQSNCALHPTCSMS